MLRSIFLKTLRDQRWPVIIWSVLVVFVTLAGFEAFRQVNPAQIEGFINNKAFLFFSDPIAVGTAAGFVTFRYGFFFALVLSIFAVLTGGRLLRGEESRGSLELVLARPQSRARVFGEKVGATAVSMLVLGLAFAVGALLGENLLHLSVSIGGALLAGFDLSLLIFFYAMLALFISQFTQTSGTAAGLAGGIYALAFTLDGTGRVYHSAAWVRRLSPNYYFNLSKPLIASYGTNWAALLFLLALGLLLAGVSGLIFLRRDVGSVATVPLLGNRHHAHHLDTAGSVMDRALAEPWLRSVLLRSLRATGPALGWWALGVFVYSAYGAGIAKSSEQQLRDLFKGSSFASKLYSDALLASNNGFVALIVYTFVAIVVMLYALMRSADWPSDQDNGRLDMVLSTPHPRWQVALQSYLAALLGFVLLALATALGVIAAALATHLTIGAGRVLAASLAFLPPMLVVAGAVYLLGARLRAGTVIGIVGAYLGVAFFIDLLRSLLDLPGWALSLSLFHAYGTPMVSGVDWVSSGVMLAIALLFTAAGIYLFQTGDLRQGG
jgi:ABC-2 type transport system permease protein